MALMCLAVPSMFLTTSYAGWFSFASYLLAIGAAFEQMFCLPHERRRLSKIDKHIKKLEFIKAKRKIDRYNYLESVPFSIQKLLYKSQCYMQENDWKSAYNEIIKTRKYHLLSSEKSLQIEIICLILWNTGNYRDYKIQLERKECSVIEKHSPSTLALLNSFYYEINDDLSQAKTELENGLIEPLDDEEKLAIYNNLARLDMVLGNIQERVFFLSKAADILKKADIPKYYRIVYHNLSMALLGEGRYSEAKSIMKTYYQSINPDNVRQCLDFTNDNIEFARALEDQSAIDEAHAIFDRLIDESKLETVDQKVSLRVSELRMLRNDKQCINDYTEHIESLLSDIENLTRSKKVFQKIILLEDMRFEVESLSTKKRLVNKDLHLISLFRSVCSKVFHNINIVDEEIQDMPPVLIEPRASLLKKKHFIRKLYIDHFRCYNKEYFHMMFKNLQEISNLCREKENRYKEVDALLIICDEFVAYCNILQSSKFYSDFFHFAFDAYNRSSNVLNNSYIRHEFQDQMIGMAYFSLMLGFDRQIANYWFSCAHQYSLSLSQFALWFRRYYNYLLKQLYFCKG